MTAVPRTQAAGVQKPPRHEVAGGLAPGRADRYGDLIFAPVVKLGAMRAQGDLDGVCGREPGRVQWASRRARGVQQRAVGGLMDRIGSRSGKPHRRTLPQLLRFGMNIAQGEI
jgi:hypothetical protein